MHIGHQHMNPVFRSVIFAGALFGAILLGWQASHAASTPKPFSSFDAQVKPIVARMTLDEKIGQMTQPDQENIADPSDVATLFIGSVLNGGSSDPKEGNSLEA